MRFGTKSKRTWETVAGWAHPVLKPNRHRGRGARPKGQWPSIATFPGNCKERSPGYCWFVPAAR